MYGEGAMNEGNVQNWYYLFKEGGMLLALNNKLLVDGIFCDLEKAPDCVNHDMLLLKLEFYGIIGKANALIKSYLNDRYQRVKINNKYSKTTFSGWGLVKQDAPRGSILGPLFSFYT